MIYPSEYYHAAVNKKIELLKEKLRFLTSSTLKELKERKVGVKQVRDIIFPSSSKGQQRSHVKQTMDGLFMNLDATLWNFIDYSLLEHIICQFGSTQLQGYMESYVANFTLFSTQTTVSQLVEYWPGCSETPSNYCELTARINMDLHLWTLEQLSVLKNDFHMQFLPPLSKFALLLCNINSNEVKWFIANDLVPNLMSVVKRPENSSFFTNNSIVRLHVRNVMVYPNPKPTFGNQANLTISEGMYMYTCVHCK